MPDAGHAGRRRPRILGVVCDLDGTLLRSDGKLSPASMSVLRTVRRLGVPLIVATARTPRAVRRVLGHEAFGRVVCANGAIVWDAERNEIAQETSFEPAALVDAVRSLRAALPKAGVAVLSAETVFVDERYSALRIKKTEGAVLLSDLDDVVLGHRIVSVAVRHPGLRADELLELTSDAFGLAGVTSFAGPLVVDVSPRAITKTLAVADEMAKANCPAEQVAVFGDMPNDLPLFAWSGWACAVANGHPALLEAADEIIPTNDDDGVATTIQRLLEL